MVNIRDKNGNLIIGARASEQPIMHDVETAGENVTTRTYTFTVQGLPFAASHTDGVNKVIQDLFIQGQLDPINISDGTHTFKYLYNEIAKLRQEKEVAEQRIDKLLKLAVDGK